MTSPGERDAFIHTLSAASERLQLIDERDHDVSLEIQRVRSDLDAIELNRVNREVQRELAFLKRFIIIGTEKAIYQCQTPEQRDAINESSQRSLARSILCVKNLIQSGHGIKVLEVVNYFHDKPLPKFEPLVQVLALCSLCYAQDVVKASYNLMTKVCNTSQKFFFFVNYCQMAYSRRSSLAESNNNIAIANSEVPLRRGVSWGSMRKRKVGEFYTDEEKSPSHLLFLTSRCDRSYNWNHRQVLNRCHPKARCAYRESKDLVLCYITRDYRRVRQKMRRIEVNQNGEKQLVQSETAQIFAYITMLETIKNLRYENPGDVERLVEYIEEHGRYSESVTCSDPFGSSVVVGQIEPPKLVLGHIPIEFLNNSGKVWEALLKGMSICGLLRNLGRMTFLGLFNENNERYQENIRQVVHILENRSTKHIHPLKLLVCAKYYGSGQGDTSIYYREVEIARGKRERLVWHPCPEIQNALEKAFIHSLKVPYMVDEFARKKKLLFAIDCNSAMYTGGCHSYQSLQPIEASVTLAYTMWMQERDCKTVFFTNRGVQSIEFQEEMTLQTALKQFPQCDGEGNAASAIQYALRNSIHEIDAFVILTSSLTNHNAIVDDLKQYRTQNISIKDTKLIVCTLNADSSTLTNTDDPFVLNVWGFCHEMVDIIHSFIYCIN